MGQVSKLGTRHGLVMPRSIVFASFLQIYMARQTGHDADDDDAAAAAAAADAADDDAEA